MPRRPNPGRRAAATAPFAERLAGLAAFALVLLVPLVWAGESVSPFRAPKSALAMVCWVALAVIFLARTPSFRCWRDPWWLPWGAVIAGAGVSAPLSPAPLQVLLATALLLPPALGWGALRQASAGFRARLASWVIAAGTLQALLALAFLSPALRPASYGALAQVGGRELWIGTLGNPGDVAVFLVLPALLAADRALAGGPRRLAFAPAALLMAAVVTSSQSLSGTLALAGGALVLAWQRVPRRRLIPALAVAVLAGLVLVAATPMRARVGRLAGQLQGTRWMWVGSGRLAGYQAAAGMLAAHPLTGVGFGRYGAESFGHQSESTLAYRSRDLGLVTGFGEAHNDLAQHAAETGLLGLALLAAAVWAAARRRPVAEEPGLPRLPLLVGAGLLALLQFPLHLAPVAGQWLVLWAAAVPPLPLPETAPRARAFRIAAVAVLVALAAVVAWRHHRATVALQQAKVLVATLRAMPDSPRSQEVARRAAAGLAERRAYLPFSWDRELTEGNLSMAAGDTARALEHFRRALRLGERPETRFNVGMALLAIGDRATGLAELERAVRLNPAVFAQVTNAEVSRALRERLDASGYGARYPWIYRGTPAARR